VNVSIDAAKDVMLYAKWSTGYKAGGANSRSLTYRAFNPETVSMFETGAKTEFWDRRARLNVSAFYGDMKNEQVDFSVLIVGNNRGTLETTNAASSNTRGFDMELAVQPLRGLAFSASYAYTKASTAQAFNPFSNTVSVVYPLYTPKSAASVAMDYTHAVIGDAMLDFHLDGNYSGKQYTNTTDPTMSDSGFLMNGRLAISDIRLGSDATLQLGLWSRNLLNASFAFLRNYNAALGTYGIFNEPRTYGIDARIRF
jgi:iron complex outermembrane receptor protein